MTLLISALAFFLLLSVLILIHEWGHFAAARKAGVIVDEFGFGLPPRVKTLWTKNGTRFSLNWIPFGGFVRLRGENAVDPDSYAGPGSFAAASVPARVMILCAGVFMNFALAIVILTIGFSVGRWVPSFQTCEETAAAIARGVMNMDLSVQIEEALAGGGGAAAGVPAGSTLTAVDGQVVNCPSEVTAFQEGKERVAYTLLVPGGTEPRVMNVSLTDGRSDVVLSSQATNIEAPLRAPWVAFWYSLRESWIMLRQTALGLGQLFLSLAQTGQVPEGITGVVGIAQLTHASVQEGFMTYLRLVALLSLSLAALNILPFPALDGGRLLFVFVEAVSRRRVNRTFELATNGLGFLFLIGLILLITYHDVIRLFS